MQSSFTKPNIFLIIIFSISSTKIFIEARNLIEKISLFGFDRQPWSFFHSLFFLHGPSLTKLSAVSGPDFFKLVNLALFLSSVKRKSEFCFNNRKQKKGMKTWRVDREKKASTANLEPCEGDKRQRTCQNISTRSFLSFLIHEIKICILIYQLHTQKIYFEKTL